MASATAKLTVVIQSIVDGFRLSKVNKELSTTRLATEALDGSFKMLQVTMAATVASALAITAPFLMAQRAVGEMDRQLRLTATAMGDQRAYHEMMGTVSELAVKYGMAKDEIASGAYEMARAGKSYTEAVELLEPAMQLAMGNAMELGDALKVSIAISTLFADQGYEIVHMLEMLDKATDSSLLNVQQLPSIIEQTGSSFAIAGIELERYLALMASLAQSGVTMGARHGSIISQMLGRERAIESILGIDFIRDGIVDLDMMMGSLAGIEKGTRQYQALLQVFGAGKGGKTFMDLMKASEMYEDYVDDIVNAGGYMEDKAHQMAESLPALMARIREAISAPFATPEIIEQMNVALNRILATLTDPQFGMALADLVVLSTRIIQDLGPQAIGLAGHALEMLHALMPAMANLSRVMLTVLEVVAGINPELLTMALGAVIIVKNFNPMFAMLRSWGGHLDGVRWKLIGVQAAMGVMMAGFMLAMTAGDEFTRWAGILIATLSAVAAAYWAVNVAKAAGMALAGQWWALPAAMGAAALVAGAGAYYMSNFSQPTGLTEYGGGFGGGGSVDYSSPAEIQERIGIKVDTINNYNTNNESLETSVRMGGL